MSNQVIINESHYCFDRSIFSLSNKSILVVLYLSALTFLIYKLGWKLPQGNLISVSIYIIALTTILVTGAIEHSKQSDSIKEVSSQQAWTIYFNCFKGTNRQILNWSYLFLLILDYYFILQLKQFWDCMFFEKVSYMYNTNFVFGSNQNVGIRKIYENSINQLKINGVTKWLIIFFISIHSFLNLLCMYDNLTVFIFGSN